MADTGNRWRSVANDPPPDGVVVETKTGNGEPQRLKQVTREPGVTRPLWFIPDGTMYVYYTPTFWRHLPGAHHG